MERYFVLGALCILVAYGLGVREAGGAWVPGDGKCYTSTQGGYGCSCSESSCGDCIQGTPNRCQNGAYGTTCQHQQDLTEVTCGGNKYEQRSRFCGEVWRCDTNPCPNACINGTWDHDAPGTFMQLYATEGCPPCEPHGG